jgi:hypothetical protein
MTSAEGKHASDEAPRLTFLCLRETESVVECCVSLTSRQPRLAHRLKSTLINEV